MFIGGFLTSPAWGEWLTMFRRMRTAVSRMDLVTGPSFSSNNSLGFMNWRACCLMAWPRWAHIPDDGLVAQALAAFCVHTKNK